jgi:hypothetical protein
MTLALLTATTQAAAAAAPSNDLVSAPTTLGIGRRRRLQLGRRHDLGIRPDELQRVARRLPRAVLRLGLVLVHGEGRGPLTLSAPTMQGDANDYLAISFVYQKTASGMTLIDCTAYGNDATWPATPGATYLIMEAGLDSAVTEEPEFSDRGGHGTVAITRSANEAHYSYIDRFTYDDCGFTVNGQQFGGEPSTCGPAPRRRHAVPIRQLRVARPLDQPGQRQVVPRRTARASTATSTSRTSKARSTRSSRRRPAGRTRSPT